MIRYLYTEWQITIGLNHIQSSLVPKNTECYRDVNLILFRSSHQPLELGGSIPEILELGRVKTMWKTTNRPIKWSSVTFKNYLLWSFSSLPRFLSSLRRTHLSFLVSESHWSEWLEKSPFWEISPQLPVWKGSTWLQLRHKPMTVAMRQIFLIVFPKIIIKWKHTRDSKWTLFNMDNVHILGKFCLR